MGGAGAATDGGGGGEGGAAGGMDGSGLAYVARHIIGCHLKEIKRKTFPRV